jgi:hypothetical protein
MTDQGFISATFPAFRRSIRARWAPVLLEPIAGSYERLVIGVAVVGENGFHLELANALDRLTCLYSNDAHGAVYAIQLAAEYLKQDLARRAAEAITDPRLAISSISIGECRDAEGESLEAIGASWMHALSSLYRDKIESSETLAGVVDEEVGGEGDGSADRLPSLVMNYVRERREGYFQYFRADLREGRGRRLTGRSHEVLIDFSGSKLVANFGTLRAGGIVKSVNLIKRRLWDLKVERDREPNVVMVRQHEMILQSQPLDDPQVTSRQHASIQEALQALEKQADQEELRLRALNTVAEIGEHVLMAEAA